jgi:hypothetical protein
MLFSFYYVIVVGAVGQFCLLFLQLRAYVQNRHKSFALLAASTLVGLFYIAAILTPTFLPIDSATFQASAIVSACAVTFQFVLGVWGAASLFASYGALARRSGP